MDEYSMNVKDAKKIARRWVTETGRNTPGFFGAFFHGSINYLRDDVQLPASSDVDVMVVLSDANQQAKLGKLRYKGVLLEVSYLPVECIQTPELILGEYHIAGSFSVPSVILDPSGQLTTLQAAVSRDFANRRWVFKRCEHAQNHVRNFLRALSATGPFHDQVTAWIFAAGVTTHLLLVAGLKNPTVRRRYSAVRQLLAEYGHQSFYKTLLEMLGCAEISRARVEQHLTALTAAFDAAMAVIKTPVPFSADISELGRRIAIDGSQEMIEYGDQREAVFWMVVTYSRCMKVLSEDAPLEIQETFDTGYRYLLADLGINSFADLQQRCDSVGGLLPSVWNCAESILASNPAITD